jgi:membrane protein required for colicin V production
MNWLDIAIIIILLIPAYIGFRKGFVRKIFGIAGLAAGFVLAVKFYDSLSSILVKIIKENIIFVNVISFLIIVILVYGISIWIAGYMSDIGGGTSFFNKLFGTAFGFLQGLILASVLLYNFAFINFPSVESRNSSMLYPHVYKVAPVLFDKIIEVFPGLKDTYNHYKASSQDDKK